MKRETNIELKDGDYNTPARLEITIKIPTIISGQQQTKLQKALDEIRSVYVLYKPAKNEKPKA